MKPFPTGDIWNLLPPIDRYTYVPQTDYIYFENAEHNPFECEATEFRLVNAWWLADAAMLAYSEEPVVRDWCLRAGFENVYWFSGESTQCFVAVRKNCIFVAFRGTQAPGKNTDIRDVCRDWRVDLHMHLVDFPRGGSIHQGFRDAVAEVWHTVKYSTTGAALNDFLHTLHRDNPGAKIWFTGHSLGAALATVAASLYGSAAGLYTFGSPMVGDREFQRHFHVPTARVVNNTDIIARLPKFGHYRSGKFPFFGWYRPVGQLKFIDAEGNIGPDEIRPLMGFMGPFKYLRLKMFAAFEKLADHAPLRYAIRIWNQFVVEKQRLPTRRLYIGYRIRRFRTALAWTFACVTLLLFLLLMIGAGIMPELHIPKPGYQAAVQPVAAQRPGLFDRDREAFYHTDEGSGLFPLFIAKSLIDPKKPGRYFLDNLERYGFIPDRNPRASKGDPSYIGLTIDTRNDFGLFRMVGVNCAACHVGQIEYRGKSIRIDGAPNMLDIVSFLSDFGNALKEGFGKPWTWAGTSAYWRAWGFIVSDTFLHRNAFQGITPTTFVNYLQQLSDSQKLVNDPEPLAGRADAFGTARNMFFKDSQPLSAPASFPHIWRLNHTAWFHWNANTNSVIERNMGQALGLGAGLDRDDCSTSIKYDSLNDMEAFAKEIEPPVWPAEVFGDQAEIYARKGDGEAVYVKVCARCHENYETIHDKYHPSPKTDLYVYKLLPIGAPDVPGVEGVGTDPNEAMNPIRPVPLNSKVCQGNNGATVQRDFGEAHEKLFAQTKVARSAGATIAVSDINPSQIAAASWKVRTICTDDKGKPLRAELCPVYPAKPLVGIWATAPYLHNGSVPTITDLLKPQHNRPTEFWVGQREYDPVNLGYVERPPQMNQNVRKFQAVKDGKPVPGNSNAGHEYGYNLADDDKKALIAFLKAFSLADEAKIHDCVMKSQDEKTKVVNSKNLQDCVKAN